MKKIFIPLFVIAALSITSCRKSRTCTCTVTSTTNGTGSSGPVVDVYGHVTKREASAQCLSKKYTTTQVQGNVTYTTDNVEDCKVS